MVEFANMAFSIKKGHVELDFSKIELYSNFLNTNLFGACFPTFFFFFCLLGCKSSTCLPRTQTPKPFFFIFLFPSFFFLIHSLLLPYLLIFPFLSLSSTWSLFLSPFFLSFSFSLFFTFLHAQPHRSLPLSLSLCPKMGYAGGYCSGSFMGCCYGFFFFFFGGCGLNFMGWSGWSFWFNDER